MNIIFRMFLYDLLWIFGDTLVREYNPCRIIESEGGISCVYYNDLLEDSGDICCNGCEHLEEDGCPVMSLGCKAWLCNRLLYGGKDPHPISNKLNELLIVARRYGVPHNIRRSRKQSLEFLQRIKAIYKERR